MHTYRTTTIQNQHNSTLPTKHQQSNHHPPIHKQQSTKGQNIVIRQININGIRNKIEALIKLIHITKLDISTIQETQVAQKANHQSPFRQTPHPKRQDTLHMPINSRTHKTNK